MENEELIRAMFQKSERDNSKRWDAPFHFNWSNTKLWALDLPIENISVQRLSWIISKPIWSTVRGKDLRDLIPQDVLTNPERFPSHFDRIQAADLRFPIDCMWMKGRYYVLDGVHRLAKLVLKQEAEAKVRRVKKEHIARIETEEMKNGFAIKGQWFAV